MPRIRAYVIAYREALKYGDDPAEYIRDSVRESRPDAPIEPAVRGGRARDPLWYIDAKISLERARDDGGIALTAYNAERIGKWLCERALEEPHA